MILLEREVAPNVSHQAFDRNGQLRTCRSSAPETDVTTADQPGPREREPVTQGTLETWVAAGEYGPVITLAGEADFTNAARLSALMSAQLSDGTEHLTIDMSGLRFADSASIRALVLAARTLQERGGGLLLLRPQQQVAGILALLGADQVITIRGIGAVSP
jgi:anti-anti-sigma factor